MSTTRKNLFYNSSYSQERSYRGIRGPTGGNDEVVEDVGHPGSDAHFGFDGLNGSEQNSPSLESDHVVSIAMQKQLLDKYQIEMQPVFPFLVRYEYEVLREQHPLLLQAVIFAACPGILSVDAQDEVTAIAVRLAAPDEIAKQEKSIEVL
ncbi:hypothetical protein DL95DRAFT_527143 [Leptodontidium sp. 2 PMI_412]|nr:hypothetical protein DL95DRAFT_527143 [Leptodontidium sp. 2 PMI_412]